MEEKGREQVSLVNFIYQRVAALPEEPSESDVGAATLAEPKTKILQRMRSTIFRVPAYIREKKERYFEPHVVSIGPIHRGEYHLRLMEEQKWRYLRDFLSRSEGKGLETFIKEMKELEPLIRRCYAETFGISSDEFVEMLLLDGSFILEFVLKCANDEEDKMIDVGGFQSQVYNDLLMLENQIPFPVLECLFEHLVLSHARRSFLEFVYGTIFSDKNMSPPSFDVYHFLHLVYYFSAPKPKPTTSSLGASHYIPLEGTHTRICHKFPGQWLTQSQIIPCAEALQEPGVTLRKKESDDLLDITFRICILEIPPLAIDKSSRSQYFNFVVFERCIGRGDQFTSHALFMNCIINTKKDLEILQRLGIINNLLASEEDVAIFFNDLAECVYFKHEKHPLAGLFENVNEYFRSPWRGLIGWAVRQVDKTLSGLSFLEFMGLYFTSLQAFAAIYQTFSSQHPGPSIL